MNQLGRTALTCLSMLLLAASQAWAQASFSDQTVAAGLTYTTSLMTDMDARPMFCGGTVGDFDRDGWPDLFLLGGGGTPDALFMNDGDGTFTDRAADWGVELLHRGRGATVGDFNGDGWPDIYVTASGDLVLGDRPGQHLLYRNNGDGTFTDVALAAGVYQTSTIETTATGAAFGDYDLDGDLDLFVSGWEAVDGNRLFRNDGDETFTDVTVSVGINYGFDGFSPRFVDMNGDRYPELLVAADFYTSRYFLNNQDGTFTDITATTGTGLEDNGMGTTVADVNRDGLPDWYVTSIYRDGSVQDGNYLYINQGNDLYTILPESSGARDGGWSWGAEALDFDHDGWVDLAVTNGWLEPQFLGESTYLFRNNGDMTFSEAQGGTTGFDHQEQGRSLLTLDYDRDGDMDLVMTAFDGPLALFRNDVSGPNTNWIEIQLDTDADPTLAPDGYGSRVTAVTGAVSQYVWVNGGASYLGRSQPVAHFGLGSATTVDLTVEWAHGGITTLPGLSANQIVTVEAAIAGAPGNVLQMHAAYDRVSGAIVIDYAPACDATDHAIYYGDLSQVGVYGFSGAACSRGDSGATSFDPAGLTDVFFVVVGNTGVVEGSYGRDGAGVERPEESTALVCELPQNLSGQCDLP